MASIDNIFSIILREANEAGLEAILPYEGTKIWANAWGSMYISKEGDLGKWLKKRGKLLSKKGYEVPIPHFSYDVMRAYSNAYKNYMKKYNIMVYDDIEYN